MRDRLAFLHLPKSAGTSYRHAIAQYYDSADTVPWSFDPWMFGNHRSIDRIPQPILLDESVDLSKYSYMEGHFALSTIERGFDAGDVVCIFREPRSRLLSHYTFWRSWGSDLRDQWLPYDVPRTARQSLADYCHDRAAAHQSDNLIARLIIGPSPLIPADGPIEHDHIAELTETAARRLDDVGFVDILERGAETFDALERWFGSPLDRVRLNETDLDGGPPLSAAELMDPMAIDRLDERTVIDRALWRHVAVRSGLDESSAAALGETTFHASLARLVARLELRGEADEESEPASDDNEEPTAGERPVALVKRGPRAVAARLADEVRHRRSQDPPQ